jgi:hypothetical protein
MDFNFFEKYGKLPREDLVILLQSEKQRVESIRDFINSSISDHICGNDCHMVCADDNTNSGFRDLLSDIDI